MSLQLFDAPETRPPRAWAEFAYGQQHRYELGRRWAPGPLMLFVMLNPSTADHLRLDPTCTRCAGFARREGFVGLTVANLYSLVATDPRELVRGGRVAVGTGCDAVLDQLAGRAGAIVAAWGATPGPRKAERVATVLSILREHGDAVQPVA